LWCARRCSAACLLLSLVLTTPHRLAARFRAFQAHWKSAYPALVRTFEQDLPDPALLLSDAPAPVVQTAHHHLRIFHRFNEQWKNYPSAFLHKLPDITLIEKAIDKR
jgi:hypothetical protein